MMHSIVRLDKYFLAWISSRQNVELVNTIAGLVSYVVRKKDNEVNEKTMRRAALLWGVVLFVINPKTYLHSVVLMT